MSKVIKEPNKKDTSKPRDQTPKCNSRKKAECPMDRSCQVNDIVYKRDATRPLPKKVYLGLAEGEWKSCFYNQKLSFKHKRYSNKTTLSSCMWNLKSASSETPNLKWSVLKRIPPFSNISKKCLLCLYEKLEIVTYQNQKELSKCRYASKFLLKNFTSNELFSEVEKPIIFLYKKRNKYY